MTDARFPDRWLNDRRLLRLPDNAFRLFVTSLMWSVANKTDGVLYDSDLPLIPRVDPACHGALVQAGLWEREWDRWVITGFADSQTTASELDAILARRASDRQRKAAERLRKTGRTRDVSRDVSRDSHAERLRQGQARQGQAPRNEVPGITTSEDSGSERAADVAERHRHRNGPTPEPGGTGSAPVFAEPEATPPEARNGPTPPQTRKRVHGGPGNDGPDDQQQPPGVHLQSPATDRNARASAANGGPVRALTTERREALRQRIAARLAASPGSTVHDLQAAIGGNRDNLLTALRALSEDGTVTQERDPADRRIRRYTLTAS